MTNYLYTYLVGHSSEETGTNTFYSNVVEQVHNSSIVVKQSKKLHPNFPRILTKAKQKANK